MKKTTIAKATIMLIAICIAAYLVGCSADTRQEMERKKIEYLKGDYDVTYTDQGIIKTWEVRDGKITSVAEKGYYFFWARDDENKEFYVQAPINRVFIEEVKEKK